MPIRLLSKAPERVKGLNAHVGPVDGTLEEAPEVLNAVGITWFLVGSQVYYFQDTIDLMPSVKTEYEWPTLFHVEQS